MGPVLHIARGSTGRLASCSTSRKCTDKGLAGRRCFAGTAVALGPRMLDLIFVAVTVGFFALSIAYTRGCDRL
jgi:hypothetical protein